MYTLEELKPLIIEWANERDLIHSENADKQRLKLIEECGELASAILKNDIKKQKDGIGDIFVVLTILAEQIEYKLRFNHFTPTPIQSKFNSIFDILSHTEININKSIDYLNDICIDLNHDLIECVNIAYNEIKDRKGKTENGTFIKD